MLLWCCDYLGRYEGEGCSRKENSKAQRSRGKKEEMVKQVWWMERGTLRETYKSTERLALPDPDPLLNTLHPGHP